MDKPAVLIRAAELDSASDASGVVALMAEELARTLGVCPESLKSAALAREQEEPTYVGRAMAVPHARVEGLARAAIYLARTPNGIRWGVSTQPKGL